jgi:acyl carrier protein
MSQEADKVKRIVAEHLEVEEWRVDLDASLIDDLGADSLDAIELLMAFEGAFSLETRQRRRDDRHRQGRSRLYREAKGGVRFDAPAPWSQHAGRLSSRWRGCRSGVQTDLAQRNG